ncbi:MAG: hypothetical protein NZ108_06580 [Bacteroidia bacterium]|nr:hypothetical protein [Bacteroidia bacterium]
MYFSSDKQELNPEAIQLYAKAMLRNQVNRLPEELLRFVEENTEAKIAIIQRYRELKAIYKNQLLYRTILAASIVLLSFFISYQVILYKPIQRWLWMEAFAENIQLEQAVQETKLLLRQHDRSGLMNLGSSTESLTPKPVPVTLQLAIPQEQENEIRVLWIPEKLSSTAQLQILNNKAVIVARVQLQNNNGTIQLASQPALTPGRYYAVIQTPFDTCFFHFDFYKKPI